MHNARRARQLNYLNFLACLKSLHTVATWTIICTVLLFPVLQPEGAGAACIAATHTAEDGGRSLHGT